MLIPICRTGCFLSFLFFLNRLSIYLLFLTALGLLLRLGFLWLRQAGTTLHLCVVGFSAVAHLVAKHGLLGMWASEVVSCELSSYISQDDMSSVVVAHRLSCPWNVESSQSRD